MHITQGLFGGSKDATVVTSVVTQMPRRPQTIFRSKKKRGMLVL